MHIPKGFLFSGMNAGIKAGSKYDLALVASKEPWVGVCFFTSNSFKAAPLQVSIAKNKKTGAKISAIIVNSGNANCFTGKAGITAVHQECRAVSKALGIDEKYIQASSTGIIKKPLPVDVILKAVPRLVEKLGPANIEDFNAAIMTTDTFAKIESQKIKISGKDVVICGVAKGAGMIAPNVLPQATMLSYIFTDALISGSLLKNAAAGSIDKSFNSVTIDGCESTNDSVFILASGKSGAKNISAGSKDYEVFKIALEKVCLGLAKKIARDGEGATKLIQIDVKGAKNESQAKAAGLAIANSFLFKTAVYGANKNIGRIAQALGQARIIGSDCNLDIWCNDLKLENVHFIVDIKQGKACWTVYTCDISEEYVKINAEYN